MTVRLRYYRYHSIHERECEDEDDAVMTAFWMIEDNSAAPDAVLAEDGTLLMDRAELDKRMDAYYEETWGKTSR